MNRILLFSLVPQVILVAIALQVLPSQATTHLSGYNSSLKFQKGASGIEVGAATFTPGDVGIPIRRQGAGTR